MRRVCFCVMIKAEPETEEETDMTVTKLNLIPTPKEIRGADSKGDFAYVPVLPNVEAYPAFAPCAGVFADYAARAYDIAFENAPGGIVLQENSALAPGAYRIEAGEGGVRAWACDMDGASGAMATILQLLQVKDGSVSVPVVEIFDWPDSSYRSLMVDLARKWHPFICLRAYVDLCWLYKVKFLHLHFIDTQSWTLPSDVFPGLPTPGRHYTKEQIAGLNAYAAGRGVELIPEIETPGHAKAMVEAYPELFADTPMGEPAEDADPTAFKTNHKNNIICAGKPGLMDNLRLLIAEIMEMFPSSRYIHIGGDEAEINNWHSCADCRKYMEENGLSGVRELYSDFVRRITDMVLEMGRRPVVWEGFPKEGADKISRDVLVIAWESYYYLADAMVADGFEIVNASWQPMYIVSNRRYWDYKDIMKWDIYSWYHFAKMSPAALNPIHLQPTDQVLGGILCAWESSYEEAIMRMRENLAALSERTWNVRRCLDDGQAAERIKAVTKLADSISRLR